jgi:hypothetical protein
VRGILPKLSFIETFLSLMLSACNRTDKDKQIRITCRLCAGCIIIGRAYQNQFAEADLPICAVDHA